MKIEKYDDSFIRACFRTFSYAKYKNLETFDLRVILWPLTVFYAFGKDLVVTSPSVKSVDSNYRWNFQFYLIASITSNTWTPFGWYLSTVELKNPFRSKKFNFYKNWHSWFFLLHFCLFDDFMKFFCLSSTWRNGKSSIS